MIIAVLFILLFQYVYSDDHLQFGFGTAATASFKNYHIRVKQPISCENSVQVRLKKKNTFSFPLKLFDSILAILTISLQMSMSFLYFWNHGLHQKQTQLYSLSMAN